MFEAKVLGVGSFVPEQRLTNADLEKLVDTSDEWIQARTGIKERRIANADQASSDLAHQAALRAMADANITAHHIDSIIVATETPDHILPSVSCQLQHSLGCRPISAFDVHATCVGFISALQIAEQFVKLGTHRTVLVVGVDTLSRITDYSDRTTCILFGDGAGAFVIGRGEETEEPSGGLLSTRLYSDGSQFDALYIPAGGSRFPNPSEDRKPKVVMQGNKVFKLAVKAMASATVKLLEETNTSIDVIDWFIPHQANQRIIDAVARELDFPESRIVSTVANFGNNSAATIPLAFDTARNEGQIKRGDKIVFASFGAGFVWGASLLTY